MDSSDDSSIAGDPVLVDSDSMDSDGAVYHEEGGLTNEPAEPHICIESICGLCSRDIGPGEWAIALLNSDETPYVAHPKYCSKRFQFPQDGELDTYQDRYPLCNAHKCENCAESPESVTMHADCYCLFLQVYPDRPVLQQVWVASAWRQPWMHKSTQARLQLNLTEAALPSVSVCTAKALGIPELSSLPTEVLRLIRTYSYDHPMWYYPIIKTRAEYMLSFEESTTDDEDTVYDLDIVTRWHRGEEADTEETAHTCGIFRLTVDFHGLLEIEWLPDWPEYRNCRPSTTRAYIFINILEASRTLVYFRFGHARIEPTSLVRKNHNFWDIPNPPANDEEILMRPSRTTGSHLHTVDLCNITGITFFYHKGTLMAVHAHTAKEPRALSTAQTLTRVDQNELLWVYIPLPRGDRILRFGLRSLSLTPKMPSCLPTTLLITTSLAGNLVIGPPAKSLQVMRVSHKVPFMLIHDAPERGGIGYFSVAGKETCEILPEFDLSPPFNWESRMGLTNPFVTTIPLNSATRIDIFNGKDTGTFRGILLEYEDGVQRTSGQCRVGVDPIKRYSRPVLICQHNYNVKGNGRSVRPHHEVKCYIRTDEHSHNPEPDDWQCSDCQKGDILVNWSNEVAELIVLTPDSEGAYGALG